MLRLRVLLLPLVFAFQSLVTGETCPAPVDVEARVRAILHLPPERELDEGYIVERHEAGLYVELRAPDSTLIGQRILPKEGSCDDLAQAASVVLAAWLSDVHPDFAGALPEVPAPAPEPPPEVAPPPPEPPPVKPPQPKPRAPLRAERPTGERERRRLELSVGAGAELAGKLALAGRLQLGFMPIEHGWGLQAFVAAAATRTEPLGPGRISWRRWPVGLGAAWRLERDWAWDLAAGPALAWLRFAGTDFDRSDSQDGLQWGATGSLRVGSRGRLGLFGLLEAQVFPGDFRAYATSPEQEWSFSAPNLAFGLTVGGWLSP